MDKDSMPLTIFHLVSLENLEVVPQFHRLMLQIFHESRTFVRYLNTLPELVEEAPVLQHDFLNFDVSVLLTSFDLSS